MGLSLGRYRTLIIRPRTRGLNPSGVLRKALSLYANIRPARCYDGLILYAFAFDLVIMRENLEGFYADRNMVVAAVNSCQQRALPSDQKITTEASSNIARPLLNKPANGRRKSHSGS